MLEVNNLVFDYPGVRALDNVSFSIREGSITALVGPNGAGKTTLLRCLAALEEPVAGSVSMHGRDILAEPRATHRQIGYLSDFFGLYDELTVYQCLCYAAMSHGIDTHEQSRRIETAADQLEIAGKLEMKAGALSRGQRQRLAIAQAIIHSPKFLLLDEPASGLDPEARHTLAALFRKLRANGMTLLVSSHILAELEEYSTDMLVLREGRIIEHSPVAPEQQSTVIEIRLSSAFAGLQELLAGLEGVGQIRVEADKASFAISGGVSEQQRVLRLLMERGVPLYAFAEQRHNMQDAYLRTVRGEGREESR